VLNMSKPNSYIIDPAYVNAASNNYSISSYMLTLGVKF
jgi:hypothetical protein